MVCISHTTALWIWASLAQCGVRAESFEAPDPSHCRASMRSQEVSAARKAVQEILGMESFPREIDVLVRSAQQRHSIHGAHPHVLGMRMPHGAFKRVHENVLVCSPELCVTQMAPSLTPIELSLLTCSLAGRYFPADCPKGFVETKGITSIASIERFLALVPPHTRGTKLCRKPVRTALGGSRSPMESATALLLTMDRRDGGYHLPRPELNHRVELGRAARAIAKTDHFIIDLYWPQIRFGLEYNGFEYHTDVARDLRRELALSEEGITIQTIALEQVLNQTQLRSVVRRVAGLHGLRLRRPPAGCLQARTKLIGELLPWSYGTGAFRRPIYALPEELCTMHDLTRTPRSQN
jgi:hypothetical protein